MTYGGTVTLLTVLSDKGYVCSTRVLRGVNKEMNKRAEEKVRAWHFTLATKNGHSVPVVVTIEVTYWMNNKGEIVSDAPTSPLPASDGHTESRPTN